MPDPDKIELDARKDNEARELVRKAMELWIEIGYSEEEIDEFVAELYAEVAS